MSGFAGLERLARRLVRRAGLPAAALAVARGGRVVFSCGIGCAPDTLFGGMSLTKALTSAAVWLLLEDGRLALDTRVAERVPEFASHGKEAVTVEHLLTHTAGFPDAFLAPLDGADPARRRAAFADWRLAWAPGSRYAYHRVAVHWVLATLIEQASGEDFRRFIRTRLLAPLGLERLFLGLPAEENPAVAPIAFVGRALPGWLLRLCGVRVPAFVSHEDYYRGYNDPAVRAVGVPSTGAIGTAGDFALLFGALLDGGQALSGRSLWRPETLARAHEVRTGALLDPMTGRRALRCLGLVRAGGKGKVYRNFGRTCSAGSIGHPGMGGQIAWADPATGQSFVFLTSGFDRNLLRLGWRNLRLSGRAAKLKA